jgi:serine protease
MASPPSGVVPSIVGSNARSDRIPSNPPRVGLKLTPDAHKQQQSNPQFIPDLILKVDPELGLIPRVGPLITCQPSGVVLHKVTLAARLDPNYEATNFDAWYQVLFESQIGIAVKDTAPDLVIPSGILQLIHKLHCVEEVESVHTLQPGPPPVDPSNNPQSGNEGYINAAPVGIDARYAWGFPGGDGKGVNVVDMEQGWDLNHEDLVRLLQNQFPPKAGLIKQKTHLRTFIPS